MISRKSNIIVTGILIIVVIVCFGLMAIISFSAWKELSPDLLGDDILTSNQSKEVIVEVETRYPSVLDGLIIFIFIGMWVAGIMAAIFREEHPAIFGFLMIGMIFVIIAGVMLGNFYEELFQDASFNSIQSSFPATNWLLTHMLTIGIIMMFTILLVMLAKNKL